MRNRCAAPIVLTLLTATACTGAPARKAAPAAPPSVNVALPCVAAEETSPLPVWARAGFTPPNQPVVHVIGLRGDIVGVVFGDPLRAPVMAGRNNKILWVARTWGAPLKIHATLNGSGLAADREVAGGPGPSIIDMPEAGCWTFTLTWGGNHDQVAVPYTGA
jgi:hypothetical protein